MTQEQLCSERKFDEAVGIAENAIQKYPPLLCDFIISQRETNRKCAKKKRRKTSKSFSSCSFCLMQCPCLVYVLKNAWIISGNFYALNTYLSSRRKASSSLSLGRARFILMWQGPWNAVPSCQITPTSSPAR